MKKIPISKSQSGFRLPVNSEMLRFAQHCDIEGNLLPGTTPAEGYLRLKTTNSSFEKPSVR